MAKRIFALGFIVLCTSAAWFILSGAMANRTNQAQRSMTDAVGGLWGDEQVQNAPVVNWVEERQVEMTETERFSYKQKKQEEEMTRAQVDGDAARTVVVSAAEIRSIIESWSDDHKLSYLSRRREQEKELAEQEGRPERLIVYSDRTLKSFKSRRLAAKARKRPAKGQEVLTLAEPNLYSVTDGPAPEFLLIAPEEFIKVVKIEHQDPLAPEASRIKVDLGLDYRKKGLLWFSTYAVNFQAGYDLVNPVDHPVRVTMTFQFPGQRGVYGDMLVKAPDVQDLKVDSLRDRQVATFHLEPRQGPVTVHFGYKSRGMNQWRYNFGDNSGMVNKFSLVMNTDFDDIDFPRESISPDTKEHHRDGPGWTLTWTKESLVSAVQIGMALPHKLNPGPLAASMSTHAPVSLLFFFFVIFLLQSIRGIKLHPMNYFFIACGFFSFNLLFSYLVDHLDLRLSFLLACVVSIGLVVSYLQLVAGTRFAVVEAGVSQFVYQILFAFAHFFEGFTGLAVTVIAIATLAVVMRLTAKIDWEEKFKDTDWGSFKARKPPAPPPLPQPAPEGDRG